MWITVACSVRYTISGMVLDKRNLHRIWRYVHTVHPWYFLAITLVSGIICLGALRHNNQRMVVLRDAVYAADKNGGNVELALHNLREYVYNHMNTSLASGPNAVHPPIQLKYTYERLQQQQADVLGKGDSSLYQEAQSYCDEQTAIGSEVISCIQNYAVTHGANLTPIPDTLYKFDFTSAKWSPDLAGWSLVVTILSALCFLVAAPYHWIFKRD